MEIIAVKISSLHIHLTNLSWEHGPECRKHQPDVTESGRIEGHAVEGYTHRVHPIHFNLVLNETLI